MREREERQILSTCHVSIVRNAKAQGSGTGIAPLCRGRLEKEFERQLDEARVIDDLRNLAEARRIRGGCRVRKLRMIEDIEDLGAELQAL